MLLPRTSYILIFGLGRSGLSMARFLAAKGYAIKATDMDNGKKIYAKELQGLGIDTQIGFHDQDTFNQAGAIVVSPGIPLDTPCLLQAKAGNVPLFGDLDIFSQYNQTPVVAITGTNGKTTVTTLVRDMLEASGITTFMGGNIGTPLVDYLMAKKPARVVVAEISSFQLDLARKFTPEIAVLLNISPDHLDRYEDMAGYCRSKWSVFKHQAKTDVAIINADIPDPCQIRPDPASQVYEFSSTPGTRITRGAKVKNQAIHLILPKRFLDHPVKIDCTDLVQVPGTHNLENMAAAALASLCAGGDITGISWALNHFRGLPHRLTFVKEINGIRFYNDSKATNVDAVIRALACFNQKVVLILGGREKDTDFTRLLPALKQVKQIIALGESARHIADVCSQVCKVNMVPDMKAAVKCALDAARPGEVVLLSPACASFDMYENYAARGNDFCALVNNPELMHHG
ncbi:MAG: UDP-N-acetylmuramoyl-L-alanine--D-glutamate ligase [Desulfotignum sp.]|nr:UDP-N-acetylmuramoyl-L-alanine--D-glutamate ligase [Desulfotignum sp.]